MTANLAARIRSAMLTAPVGLLSGVHTEIRWQAWDGAPLIRLLLDNLPEILAALESVEGARHAAAIDARIGEYQKAVAEGLGAINRAIEEAP